MENRELLNMSCLKYVMSPLAYDFTICGRTAVKKLLVNWLTAPFT